MITVLHHQPSYLHHVIMQQCTLDCGGVGPLSAWMSLCRWKVESAFIACCLCFHTGDLGADFCSCLWVQTATQLMTINIRFLLLTNQWRHSSRHSNHVTVAGVTFQNSRDRWKSIYCMSCIHLIFNKLSPHSYKPCSGWLCLLYPPIM